MDKQQDRCQAQVSRRRNGHLSLLALSRTFVGRADGGLDARTHAWQWMEQPAAVLHLHHTRGMHSTILRRCSENGLQCTVDSDGVEINVRCTSIIAGRAGVPILTHDNTMNQCPSMHEAGSAHC
jgi:hypothetical protein